MQDYTRRIIIYCHSTVKITRVNDHIDFIIIFVRLNKKSYIMCYSLLKYDDNLILVLFSIKMSFIIVFFNISESVMSCYFMSQFFEAVKELNKVR